MSNEQQNQKRENYKAIVTANALTVFKTGTNAVAIQVQAVANLQTGEECDKDFVGYLNVTPRTAENTIKTLRDVFGFTGKSFAALNDSNALMGKECEITVTYEEYNGEMRAKVQWFNAPGSFASRKLKPLDANLVTTFTSMYDGYFTAPTSTPAAGSARHPAPASNAAEDDLPF